MASINFNGGDGYSSPTSESVPPVISVTFPAAEQIASASTDWCAAATSSAVEESVIGGEHDGGGGGGSGGDGGGGNVVKKAVWSKPVNGVVEVVSNAVMGAVSWPALGESTKAGSKSSSSELLQALQVTASVDPTATPEHGTQSGQRSVAHGGVSNQLPESQELKAESPHKTSGKPAAENAYKESPRGGFGSQSSSGGTDRQYQRNSFKRGNGGPHSRGGYGSYHQNYGGKVDQGRGRGGQEWNQHRNFNRDANMQPQRGGYSRGGYAPPYVHNSTPFIYPTMQLPGRPFGTNVMYPDVASGMVYFQGPVPPMVQGQFYFPVPDPLHDKIVKQIDYYFSNDNLVKDIYLRQNMDEQGWVPVNLVAGFNQVSSLTGDINLILDVMKKSTVVEVQGDKMRRRNDWMRWLMPPAVQDSLGSQLQGIRLHDGLRQGGGDRATTA